MHKDTKKLKRLYRKHKKDNNMSFKEFAKEHALGQEWLDRKMLG